MIHILGWIRHALAFGAALVVVIGLAACNDGMAHRVVVKVGGTAFTETTVRHWMSIMAGGRVVGDLSQRRYQSLQRQALSFLISSEWLIDEAVEEHLKVSKQEIGQRFKEKKHASFPGGEAEFREFLKATGQKISDTMFEAKVELASSRIRQMVASDEAKVTQEQVVKYYSRHKQRFAVPERRELEITNRKSEAEANKLKREAESRKNFASLSGREWLERPSASDVSHGYALVRAVFSAKLNVLTGPIKRRVDYYLFEIKQIIPSGARTLTQVQGVIEKQLAIERWRKTLAVFIKAWRKKWIARTDCAPGFVVQKCRQYRVPKAAPLEDPYSLK